MYTFPRILFDELADEFALRDDYSGRFMYNARCIGLTGHIGDLVRFVAACARTADDLGLPGEEILAMLAASARSDNMGYDHIYYFTDVKVEEP